MTAQFTYRPTGAGIELTLSCPHATTTQILGPKWNSAKSKRYAMRSMIKARLAEQPCECVERMAAEGTP